ncbi:hypothetical protein PHISP_07170 [Aspergillus sp. HF37]|nr:hypothetical protein PHISP_07170 [Aspergillus sp. HF37]
MKFTAAIATFLGAVSAAAAPAASTLPEAFTLVADGGYTVMTDGYNLFYGNGSSNDADKEIAILRAGTNGAISFLAKDAVPTAFQNLYVVEDTVLPVRMTVPHSAAMPDGGDLNGFGVNDDGYLTHDGKAWFAVDGYGDNPVKKVYWYGSHNSVYRAANLWVKECKGC